MKPPFQSRQGISINAPLEAVWAFNMDLSKIPEFHPSVFKVDLISGRTNREAGASYRCHLSGGKHTCIEKDIEVTPMEKIVTVLPEDTYGISKILNDYMVETTFQRAGEWATRMKISHYYSTRSLKAKLISMIAKRKIAHQTQAMLQAIKTIIEREAVR
ncbi:MAG: SRPBCC family protein [Terracidiphilus sp.]